MPDFTSSSGKKLCADDLTVEKRPHGDQLSPPQDKILASISRNSVEDARRRRTKLMLHGPVGPTLARLAAPNVVSMFVMSAMSIAEGYFAGQLGISALAGLALVYPLVMLTQMLAAGAMGGAISSAIARALGGNDSHRAAGLVIAAFAIATAAAIAMAVLMLLFGNGIFVLLGGQNEGLNAAKAYAFVYFPCCFTIWICHSSLSVLRGTGDMIKPSAILFVVSILAIPLSGILSIGSGSFQGYGVAGLAAGQVIAYGAGALFAVGYIAQGRAGIPLDRSSRIVNWSQFSAILRVGLVASLNTFQTVLTILLMVGLFSSFGKDAIAGYGLGARLEFLMIPIIFGIGAAMTAMVGTNIGAGQTKRALQIAWIGSLAAGLIVGGIGCILAIMPNLWLGIFIEPENTDALDAGRSYFQIVGPFYAFFAIGLALYFASQGAGRMIWPVVASVCRILIAFFGALGLLKYTNLGINSVYIAIATGMLAYGIVTALAIRITQWR